MPDIEDQIRRAQEEGLFDDLNGKGKPLRLDQNPHEDPDWRLAYHVLRSSGYSLPWIEELREIESELEKVRQSLANAWEWRCVAMEKPRSDNQVQREWERAQVRFRDDITRLNQRINDYNLTVPSERFQRHLINSDDEIDALTKDKG